MRLLVMFVPCLAFGDWLQWGGPNRDFTVTDVKGLNTDWSRTSGPARFWSRPLGDGYSAIVTDGVTLYTMYHKGNREITIALNAKDGKTIWEHAQDATFQAGTDMQFGPGPHATPLISGDLLFSVGIRANLHAYNRETGKVVWSHDLYKEFNGEPFHRGFAVSPIAYKDTVIMKIGGRDSAVVAFRQKDGAVIWKKHAFEGLPAVPTIISVDGQDQLLIMTADSAIGLDPGTGEQLWKHGHRTQYGLNISTPVWGTDHLLFISSGYDGGSRVLKLTREHGKTKVEELWAHKRMRVHFTTVIRIGGYVYGSSGDFGPTPLTCVDVQTGKVMWQDRTFAKSNLLLADGKLVLLDEEGNLALVTVSPEGMHVLAKDLLLSGRSWTAPTLDGKRLYLRDRNNIIAVGL